MAGETRGAAVDGFGRVSRTAGIVFRYVLLAATMAGIVALAVLLAYVTNDAIRPLTAEPAWMASTLVTMGLAPLAVAVWLRRSHPAALRTGFAALGLLVVGLLYGGGAVIVFIDVVPAVAWLSFVIALAIPLVAVYALERFDAELPFLVRVALVIAIAALSLWGLPGVIQSLPTLPADWLILWLTLGGPAAGLVAWYADGRFGERRAAWLAAAVSFALVGAFGVAGLVTGLGASALAVLATVGVLPFAVYAGSVLYDDDRSNVGLLLPTVAVGGVATGLALERLLGLAGPESWLDWQFLTSTHASQPAEAAGIYPGIVGTLLLMVTVALASFPVGVGAAVYLEEYAPDTRFTRIIDVNISNLAGVPSVVYGLLGLGAFIRFGGLAPGTVIVGGLTLALLILPIVIISAREAIRGIPDSRRRASYGMGATRWQTVRNVVLPEAFPGILTGTILALGRAVGETAPLLVIGAPAIFGVPDQLGDRVGAIPVQIYAWASTFGSEAFYTTVLAAGVVTILVILLTMNSIAIVLRNKYQRDT